MPVDLAAAAVSAIVPQLSKLVDSIAGKAAEAGASGAGRLLDWLRTKLSGRAKEALNDLEAAPESSDNQADLRKQITKQLEAEPALRAELAALVGDIAASGEAMVQTVSGSGATGVQNRGDNNQVTIER